MKIAIFDYRIVPTNPIGSCHLRAIEALCDRHEITVFANEFANPDSSRVRWIRVPVPTRPLALLFLSFHVVSRLVHWLYLIRHRTRFDIVQTVESNTGFGDISYTHFCHRAYLHNHFQSTSAPGLRGWLRWLDHYLHALLEPLTYRRCHLIVVPSEGLKRELETFYPFTRDKIVVIPNPIDSEHFRRPDNFDLRVFRAQQGLSPDDVVLAFVALGHFERKGLPILLAAMAATPAPSLKLLIVGGTPDLVAVYRRKVHQLGLEDSVRFVGMQQDVRPFLWAADGLILPSAYEAFPLVAFQAAAAGLPLISTRLNGVEEFLQDGRNGILVERSIDGISQGLTRFLSLSPENRKEMGRRGQSDVKRFSVSRFVEAWDLIYRNWNAYAQIAH